MNKTRIFIILGLISILVAIILLRLPITVKSSSPPPNAKNVDLKSFILIDFNRRPNPEKISIEFSPPTEFKIEWENNQLKISPSTAYSPQTQYQLTIRHNQNIIYSLPYQTRALNIKEAVELGKEQANDDFLYSQAKQKTISEKPYIALLPIETDIFTAVYNYNNDKIRIRFKNRPQDDVQRQKWTSQAIEKLSELKIDTKAVGYYFLDPLETNP